MEYMKPSKVIFKKPSLKEKEGDVFKMFNLMTPLITTFGMGSTLFSIK
jgi:hypothetical protein